jgi:hypothetical protein
MSKIAPKSTKSRASRTESENKISMLIESLRVARDTGDRPGSLEIHVLAIIKAANTKPPKPARSNLSSSYLYDVGRRLLGSPSMSPDRGRFRPRHTVEFWIDAALVMQSFRKSPAPSPRSVHRHQTLQRSGRSLRRHELQPELSMRSTTHATGINAGAVVVCYSFKTATTPLRTILTLEDREYSATCPLFEGGGHARHRSSNSLQGR